MQCFGQTLSSRFIEPKSLTCLGVYTLCTAIVTCWQIGSPWRTFNWWEIERGGRGGKRWGEGQGMRRRERWKERGRRERANFGSEPCWFWPRAGQAGRLSCRHDNGGWGWEERGASALTDMGPSKNNTLTFHPTAARGGETVPLPRPPQRFQSLALCLAPEALEEVRSQAGSALELPSPHVWPQSGASCSSLLRSSSSVHVYPISS